MKKKMTKIVVMVTALLLSPNAYGESPEEEEMFQLETVTVTAQKKKEDAQKVPISMDVFSETEMEDARILNVPDMVRFSPNVNMMERSCEHIVVIRGISPFRGTTYSNAGFYVDDVSYPLHYGQNIDFFDLERAEVLKGPQGTLYGRNAESGVINLITKQPGNQLSGKILAEYGDYNSFRSVANVSGPVVDDTLYLGGAFQYRSSDGYVENQSNGDDRADDLKHLAGRATLRWTPSDLWNISLMANIMNADDHGAEARFLTGPQETDPHKVRRDTDAYLKQNWNSQIMRVKYNSDDFGFLSVTGLLYQDLDKVNDCDLWDNPKDRKINPIRMKERQYSQEFRMSSKAGPVEWLAGLYGFIEDSHFNYRYEILSAGMTYMNPITDIDARGCAAFGQGTYTFLDRFHLTLGLRLDHEEMEGDLKDPVQQKAYNKDLSFNEVLPKFSLSYDASRDIMAYASVSKGYLVGGYNWGMTGTLETFSYDPEYTWNYETGIKTNWLNNKLTANLSVFYISIDNKQISELHPTIAMTTITNAAKAHSQGLELEFQAKPFRGLNLSAGFGCTEAKFDRFTTNLWNDTGTGMIKKDYKGNYLPYAPRYTYNVSAQYRNIKGLFARADLLGTGPFYGEAANKAEQNAYATVNLRLGYEWRDFNISFWMENVFDKQYCTFLSPFQQSIVGIDGPPRTFGATAVWRF